MARGLTIGDVAKALDDIAPPALAQSWDHVGLLVGDRRARCTAALLCIDLTPPVLDEAIAAGCELVMAYHPPIFRPLQRVLADGAGSDAIVHRAIAAGIGVYSPHTALDAAEGGTNDVLAGMCRLTDVRPFEYVPGRPAELKLVTFLPEQHVGKVSAALFAAGAGQIGDYEQCSFRLLGEGTFFGRETTSPRVGRRGQLERVREIRLEVVVPHAALPDVVAALRRTHPYEEPAFDLYPLTPEPARGIGRVGRLPTGTTLKSLVQTLRRATRSAVATMVGAESARIRTAAVCVGAAGRLPLEKPASAACDVIVTGEIRHHDALEILRHGKTAIALGHWESERPVLASLGRRLGQTLPGLKVGISRRDAGPFSPA